MIEDPLAAARGVVLGVLIGCALWLALFAFVLAVSA